MSKRVQLVCAWSGIAFTLLFLVGFALAGFITPPSPTKTAAEVARMFDEHRYRIRTGLLVATLASALLALWTAEISVQMRRIEGKLSPLAYAQMLCGACLIIEFLFPLLFWQTAAYRPDRSPELVQMLHDLGWLPFLGIACTAVMQGVVIGWIILRDTRDTPLFPRWSGYFSIWVVLMFTPASCVVLTQNGPLAWNGLISWWLAVVTFFVWMVGISWVLIKAINRETYQPVDVSTDLPGPDLPRYTELVAEVTLLRDIVERASLASPVRVPPRDAEPTHQRLPDDRD